MCINMQTAQCSTSNVADLDAIRDKLAELAAAAVHGCGLSDVLFFRKFSASVDAAFSSGSMSRSEALSIAIEMGYMTPDELEAQSQQLADDGCCSHGLDPDCCPCGCGDI